MKKTFIHSLVTLLFIFGITILSTHNSEAYVTANIDASSTSVALGSGQVAITYSSSGADSCTLNGNPVSNSGTYYFTPSSVGSFTFRIECKHLVVEPTGTCVGTRVIGSVDCSAYGEGVNGGGAHEGMYCNSFTTKDACEPPMCSSWFHHGCHWSVY